MSPREYDDGGHDTSSNKPVPDREPEPKADEGRKPDSTQEQEPPPAPPRRRLALYVVVPLAMLIGWGVYGHWRQSSNASDALKQAQAAVPNVQVASVHRTSNLTATTLPGQTAAFASADLFARATGYVTQRMVDIGSHVKKGDLLLTIASPDLDQQLEQAQAQLGQMQAQLQQAQANLGQANANSKLALVTRNRSQILAGEGWDTKQNRDTQVTNYNVSSTSVKSAQAGIGVAVANVRAQQANVDRLVALTGFENVKAPFDGVITQRDVDVGNLVQSDASTGTALLHIDQQDLLRCQVYVPQSQFTGIHTGLPAHVTVPELPGQVFKAVVSRSSVSLAQNSRSMLVEVDIDNRDGRLTPGLFVTVSFDVARPTPVVVVPDAALIFDASGLHVAVVGQDSKVTMRTISIARDTGTEAELREGLDGTEKVIVNPPTDLSEGQKVHVLPEKKAEGKQASG